jgi:predicted acyl esterase
MSGFAASCLLFSTGCIELPPYSDHPRATPLSETTEAWWAYQRAVDFEVIHSEIDVPVRDGTPINCVLSRPAVLGAPAEGVFPGLIVEFTPYALIRDSYEGEAAFFAQRGYNALTCNVRGTGKSGGEWDNAFSRQDGRDAYDLIEWLAAQRYSNGRIGQFGESYGGGTSYAAAMEQPPHLVAVAPMQPPGDLYRDVIYPGGIKTTQGGPVDAWPPIAQLLSLSRIDADAEYEAGRNHPTYDDFWKDHSYGDRHDAIQVPVLTIGGWDDGFFRSGTLSNIEAAPERTWAIYGQWLHLPPVALGPSCSPLCLIKPLPSGVLLAWFDHWLMQLPDVPLPQTPIFISEEGPRGKSQGWREVEWLAEAGNSPTYELGSDGSLVATATNSAVVTINQPIEPDIAGGSASFTTMPFTEDRILLGHAVLAIRATLSADDANFYIELIDVAANGKERVVNEGFLKASHRNSDINPEPVTPGVAIDYRIPVRADHYRFAAGNQLRIRISGGSRKMLEQPTQNVAISLQTGAESVLYLPQGW